MKINQTKNSIWVNLVLLTFAISNIIGLFVLKDSWQEQVETGWQAMLSRMIYGVAILLMLPSLTKLCYYFPHLKIMAIIIIVYIIIAYFNGYNSDIAIKFLLNVLTFIFFSSELYNKSYSPVILHIYIISAIAFVTNAVIQANVLEMAMTLDKYGTGQATSLSILFLIPLIYLIYGNKIGTYFYLFCLIVVFISLRRTAIIACFLCFPFLYSRFRKSVSKGGILVFAFIFVLILYYIYSRYWYVLQYRFLDLYQANDNGEYGSGRTGWLRDLWRYFMRSPEYWLQGYGVGMIKNILHKMHYSIGHAHNDYYEVLLTYGILGFSLWFSTFVKIFRLRKKSLNIKNNRSLIFVALFVTLFCGMASSTLSMPQYVSIPIFIGILFNESYLCHKKCNNSYYKLI